MSRGTFGNWADIISDKSMSFSSTKWMSRPPPVAWRNGTKSLAWKPYSGYTHMTDLLSYCFTSHSTPNRSFRRRHAPSTCCCYRIHIAIAGAVVDEIACTDGIHDKDFSAAARGDCCGNYCTVNIRVVYICFASWLICRPSPSPSWLVNNHLSASVKFGPSCLLLLHWNNHSVSRRESINGAIGGDHSRSADHQGFDEMCSLLEFLIHREALSRKQSHAITRTVSSFDEQLLRTITSRYGRYATSKLRKSIQHARV